tara:strand:- start:1084 stop:1848 length:765 start_codon:yes stop_codon:yes gene_type:complete
MKITTQYKNNEPAQGSRSGQYLGLALFMETDFFHVANVTKWGLPYPDTRINLFTRKTQEGLRMRIWAAAEEFSLSRTEAGIEWSEIVKRGTAKATEYIKDQTSAGTSKDYPLTLTEHGALVSRAFKVAVREVGGIVTEREEFKGSWTVHPSFDLSEPSGIRIYIRKNHPAEMLFKIGKSGKMKERDASYRTHSPTSVKLAQYFERGILKEKNLHLYYKEKRVQNEFFKLSADDLEIATDPKKMMQVLISAGFTN